VFSSRTVRWPTWVARGAFVAALAAVAWTSLLPVDDLPGVQVSDKLVHVAGYAVLGALARLSGLRWPAAVAVVAAFGLLLELAQGASGYRSFEWADLLADVVGATGGAVVASIPMQHWSRHRAALEHERKRQRRRERRAAEAAPPERPRNPARAAARTGPPRWQQVADRQGRKCWLCGARVRPDDRQPGPESQARQGATFPVVDFVVDPEHGGTYAWDNVRLAHVECQRRRRARPHATRFTPPLRSYE
jgi:VanZ family protein